MNKISLSAYKISIYLKRHTNDLQILSDFDNGEDFITLINQLPLFVKRKDGKATLIDDAQNNKRLRLRNTTGAVGRIVSGTLETGDYGVESVVVDQQGDDVYTIEKDKAPMKPFFFLCSVPENKKQAILIIQRFQQYGIYSSFSKILKEEFKRHHPEFTLKIIPVSQGHEDLVKMLNDGVIKKASFVTYNPLAIAENIQNSNINDNFQYNDVYLEVNLVAKRNRVVQLKNSLIKLVKGEVKTKNDTLSIKHLDHSKLKISISLNGKQKVIDMSRLENISDDKDITDRVRIDNKTGHPNTDDILNECMILLDELNKEV